MAAGFFSKAVPIDKGASEKDIEDKRWKSSFER